MNNRIQNLLFALVCCLIPSLAFGQTFTGDNNPQPIPVTGTGGFPCTGGPVTSVAAATFMTGDVIGTDIAIENVTIDLTHTWASDIEADLISPAGTVWDLTSDNGGAGDNYTMTMFVDGAPSITTGAPPFTGMFEAEQGPFATGFDGQAATGDWTLSICDDAGGDTGNLLSFTITFGELCQIDVPADITADAAADFCGAQVEVIATAPTCTDPVENDFNDGGLDASGEYPVGTTTVTFTSGPTEATVNVTVVDVTGPVFNCPADLTFNLDAGECEKTMTFDVTAVDNCPPGEFTLSNNTVDVDAASVSNSLACPGGGYQTLQVYDLAAMGYPNGLNITGMNTAIFQIFGNPTLTANLYSLPAVPGGSWDYADATLIGTGSVGASASGTAVLNIPLDAPVMATGVVAIELVTPSQFANGFIPGYGVDGGFSGTYLASDFCNVPNPDLVGNVLAGFTDQWIVELTALSETTVELTSELGSGDPFPIGTTEVTYLATDAAGNTSECAFNVTVEEFASPVTALACNDNVNISTNEDCEVFIGADVFLEGGPYGCYESRYDVYVWPFNDEASEIGPFDGLVELPSGSHTAVVVDVLTGNRCWGTFLVEDKTAPVLECADVNIDLPCGADFEPGDLFNGSASAISMDFPSVDNTTVTDAVELTGIGEITDVNVQVNSTHTWVGDLVISVTSPEGTTVELMNNIGGPGFGCAGNGLDVLFDDEAEDGYDVLDGTCDNDPAAEGTFQPISMLSAFIGENAEGTWTVSIEDLAGGDGGTTTTEIIVSGAAEIPGPSIAVDNCDDAVLTSSDEVFEGECGTTVFRTWVATDGAGNESNVCVDTFNINPLGLADLDLPLNNVGPLPCGSDLSPAALGIDGVPSVDGVLITELGDCAANFIYDYSDQVLPTCGPGCGGGVKVLRTWTIIDWCTNEVADPYVQLIKTEDTEGPTFGLRDKEELADPWTCATGNVILDVPWELADNCSDVVTYTVSSVEGYTIFTNNLGQKFVQNLPEGVSSFAYTATDCCGNETTQIATITVVDKSAPIAITKSNIAISLTAGSTDADGGAKLYWNSVDNGSYDGCDDDITILVRRVRELDNGDIVGVTTCEVQNRDFRPFVKFCCLDESGEHMVEMLVCDTKNNCNVSWTMVQVDNKIPPVFEAPADVEITCEDDYTDLDLTGEATSTDGPCGGSLVIQYIDDTSGFEQCGAGTIFRYWYAGEEELTLAQAKQVGQRQRIDISTVLAGPGEIVVRFDNNGEAGGGVTDEAQEVELDMCAGDQLGYPVWSGERCDVIAYNMEVDTFSTPGDLNGPCFKVIRTFKVINWCTYDATIDDDPTTFDDGVKYFTQIFKVYDETKPEIANCEDDQVDITYNADCSVNVLLNQSATDPGTDNCPTNQLYWTVTIDQKDDELNKFDDIIYSTFEAPNSPFYIPATTNEGLIQTKKPFQFSDGILLTNLPIFVPQTYTVKWTVTDGCNNVTTCNTEFTVQDLKQPTPYCIDVSTAVMPLTGSIEIWARDFDLGSFDNCTAEENLHFTFGSNAAPNVQKVLDCEVHYFDGASNEAQYQQGIGQKWIPNPNCVGGTSARIFNCDDLVDGSTIDVEMVVWDASFNMDWCNVELTINDSNGVCTGNRPTVAGDLETATGIAASDVEVTLSAPIVEYPRTTMTDAEGHFAFENNLANQSYQITASNDVDYLNGVTTLDLVKIQRHLLEIEALDSPYKVIAADINADDELKANDLAQLRKLILGVIAELPTNESWRFVDASQEMESGFDLASVRDMAELSLGETNMMNNNLIAVKVGDVTDNAIANLSQTESTVRSNKVVEFTIENAEVQAGQTVSVDFASEDFNSVFGYQFTMELNGLEFAGVQSGAVNMTEANFGVLKSNVVTVSYNEATARSASADETVFTIEFTATQSGSLANMIKVTSNVTPSEAYVGEELEVREVVISTRGDVADAFATELFQNEPNPFRGQTTVGFNLAEAAKATVSVLDVTGKVVLVRNIDGAKGYNAITFTASELGTSGVLYYQLESGEFTATKKMIIID